MKAIEFIYQELNNGRVFCEHVTNVKYPYLWEVLYLTPHDNIGWTYYGSSAAVNTIDSLSWLLENIFNMSAEHFLERYVSATREYIDHYNDSTDTQHKVGNMKIK
jgi:hypothetical protein